MKSMCKHWDLHISTNINCLGAILDSFWAVWRGLLWCLKAKLRSWWFPRYWQFNKQYHGDYQLICLISQPLLIALKHDWYQSKGLLKGFKLALRLWESLKNWWRYDQMKFVTWYIRHKNTGENNRTGQRENYLIFLRRTRPLVLPDLIDMLEFRHSVAVWLGHEFEVPDRLKNVITSCGESFIKGI